MKKNLVGPLAGLALLAGALTACGGSDDGKRTVAETGPATSAPAPAASGSRAPAPESAPPTTGSAPAEAPAARPKANNSQIVLIDPSGKKYTRKEMVRMATVMAGAGEGKLPPDFCEISYKQGVDGGGRFPAGKDAYMDACKEGMELGS